MIEFSDVPGFDNVITVVIIIPVDGVYKKISLDFYILSCNFSDNYASYFAVFKCMALEKTHLKQISLSGGCSSKFCQLPSNDKPNTYELLHCIANECGLGFAATQQTKEIKDYNYRLVYSQNFIDVIKEHVSFGWYKKNSSNNDEPCNTCTIYYDDMQNSRLPYLLKLIYLLRCIL